MKVVFLTMSTITSLRQRGIYQDLMRFFVRNGHELCVVSPRPRHSDDDSSVAIEENVTFIRVNTWNVTKSKNILEKGLGQLLIESQFIREIKNNINIKDIDLILYSTPPVTFANVIEYLKKASPKARTYLLLKDIFPQNAVDIGLMTKNGLKGLVYKFFRNKEKKLYSISDYIGCMSPANVDYVLKHNPELSADRVEVAPNSIELKENELFGGEYIGLNNPNVRQYIRSKYHLPLDKPVIIYGGNFGKPQGIPFIIKCLDANANRTDCHFVLVGDGTERSLLESWYYSRAPESVTLLNQLPKDDYDMLARSCDVGLVFLDYRFTVPNFPSRLLSYMENRMPVLCATDPNCDMGRIAEKNGFGYWCESNSVEAFTEVLDKMISGDIHKMGEAGYEFLLSNYLTEHTYNAIMRHF